MSEMESEGVGESRLRALYVTSVKCFLLITTLLNLQAATISTSTFGGNETDRVALLSFKSKIKHDPQGVLRSWNDSLYYCDWEGVTCGRKQKRVAILNLESKGLVGSLSPAIGNLSHLNHIILANNTFQGIIPPEVGNLRKLVSLHLNQNAFEGKIPVNISGCSNLLYLSLALNKLSGKIPVEFASFSKLTQLVINDNYLTGSIPSSVGNLTSLTVFSAARSGLSGIIPESFGQLRNLSVIALGSNNLSGTIPRLIYNISSITVLSVSGNQLRGSIPSDVGLSLPNLQYLQTFGNSFTGSIPTSLSNASELYHIEMMDNNFSGMISVRFGNLQHLRFLNLARNSIGSGEAEETDFLASLFNCSKLRILDLSSNQLKGMLPSSVANLSSIIWLSIGVNRLYGRLPSGLGSHANLAAISMEANEFTGTIPRDIGQLQNLQGLFLDYNRLSGEIPSSLGNITYLSQLYLDHNRFHGNIPSSLGNFKTLTALSLRHSNLSGSIPKELFGIFTLSLSLDLSQNQLVGSLPAEVGSLKNLLELDVSENKLSGEIPSTLGSCVNLVNLHLESNFFEGAIPRPFSSLSGIQNLDLSHNNLSGKIPEYLQNFSLISLDLSFNNFEGEVPTRGSFANASAISVKGNKRLCGGISELQLPRCITEVPKDKGKLSPVKKLMISIASAFFLVTMIASVLYCWFRKQKKEKPPRSSQIELVNNVSYQRLLKATDGFSAENLLGVGSFGSVYKGILEEGGEIVAIKVINLQQQGASKSFMAECEALRNIRHRNVVKVITSCSSIDFQGNDFKALVYEFMPKGTLERWLHPIKENTDDQINQHESLTLLQRVNIGIDVASALDYLHHGCEKPIVHCDLKPNNILLDSSMTAHVGDFGLAKFLPHLTNPNQSSSIAAIGTIGYTAPEYGFGCEVSTNGDVYSYGILLLEMITGKAPTMFEEGRSLHNFARTALPDKVTEIVDQLLLNDTEATAFGRKVECLISMVKIGVACSVESPQDRMNMATVLNKLNSIKKNLVGTRQ